MRVDTAIGGGAPWHVRLHRIVTDRELSVQETGFALPWEPEGFTPPSPDDPERGRACASSPWGASAIVHLGDRHDGVRRAEVVALSPNANIMAPHTIVPALTTTLSPGEHWLACAVGASDDVARIAVDCAPDVTAPLRDRLVAFVAREDPA